MTNNVICIADQHQFVLGLGFRPRTYHFTVKIQKEVTTHFVMCKKYGTVNTSELTQMATIYQYATVM